MKLHGNAKDIAGTRFGRLTALHPARRVHKRVGTKIAWLCRCNCGNECEVFTTELMRKKVQSCGCLRRDQQSLKPRALGSKHPPLLQCASDSPLMTQEERVIADYPLYTVTTDGRVHSYRNYKGGPKRLLARTWHKTKSGAGYAFVGLFVEGKSKRCAVHRLVAKAFLDPPHDPEATIVRHLDGNSRNNSLSNLAWGTAKDNAADKRRHNRNLERGRHPMAKLNEEKVAAARAAHKAGYSYKQIGAFLGVAPNTIGCIIRNEHWPEILEHVLGVTVEELKREAQREAA